MKTEQALPRCVPVYACVYIPMIVTSDVTEEPVLSEARLKCRRPPARAGLPPEVDVAVTRRGLMP